MDRNFLYIIYITQQFTNTMYKIYCIIDNFNKNINSICFNFYKISINLSAVYQL